MKAEKERAIFKEVKLITAMFVMIGVLPFITNKYTMNQENILEAVKKTEFDFFKVDNLQEVLEDNSGLKFEYKDDYLRVYNLNDYEELTSIEYIEHTIEDSGKGSYKSRSFSKSSIDHNFDFYDLRFFKKENVYVIVHNKRINKVEENGYILDEIVIKDLQKEDALKIDKNGEILMSPYVEGVDVLTMHKIKDKEAFKLKYQSIDQLKPTINFFYTVGKKSHELPLIFSLSFLSIFISIFSLNVLSLRKKRRKIERLMNPPRTIFFNFKKKKEKDILIDKIIEKKEKLDKENVHIKEPEKFIVEIKND